MGKAYTPEEKERILAEARKARSPHRYRAIMLSLNAGVRDAERKRLTWAQIDMQKRCFYTVGRSKTEAGTYHTAGLRGDRKASRVPGVVSLQV